MVGGSTQLSIQDRLYGRIIFDVPTCSPLEFSDMRSEEILLLNESAASLELLNFFSGKDSVFKNTILCP